MAQTPTGERVVTELTIDARGAAVGSAEYIRAMNAAQGAVDRLRDAEARADQAQQRQGDLMVGKVANINKIAAAYDKLRGSVDPLAKAEMAAQQEMQRALLTTDAAVKRGLATQEQASATISALRKRQILDIQAVTAAMETENGVALASERIFESARELAVGLVAGFAGAAIFVGLAELPEKVRGVIESTAGLANSAEVIGTTTKALQELQYAGELVDVSADKMTAGMEKFSKQLGGASAQSSELGKIFRANHLVISGDLTKDLATFADLVDRTTNASQRNNLVMTAFGKGSANIGLILKDGSAGLREYMAEADAAGAVIDDRLIATAKELDDQFKILEMRSSTSFKVFAISLAPLVLAAMRGIDSAAVFLSQHFDVIAKTVEIAGAAMLGFFGPAAVVRIGALALAIGEGLVGAIKAVGLAMLANPLGLLIGGIAAVITAAFLFRDQIKSAIGVDVVGVIKDAGNDMIAAFVGGFNAIRQTWGQLPAVLGDLAISAVNNMIGAIESLLNKSRADIIKFMIDVSVALGPAGAALLSGAQGLAGQGNISLGRVDNPNENAATTFADTWSKALKDAQHDYLGDAAGVLGGAWNSTMTLPGNKSFANDNGTGVAGGGGSASEFDKALRNSREQTAALVAQQKAIGLNSYEATRLEAITKLQNAALRDSIGLSPRRVAAIEREASAYAKQKSILETINGVYTAGRDIFKGFFSDLSQNQRQGQTFWQSLANAGVSALQKIQDKMLDVVTSQAWDLLWGGGQTSGGGGLQGILGSILGAIIPGPGSIAGGAATPSGGFIPGITGPRLFSGGGYTGAGSASQFAGYVHGSEYVFSAPATSRLGVGYLDHLHQSARGYSSGGFVAPGAPGGSWGQASNDNSQVTIAPTYNFNGSGFTEAQARRLMSDNNRELVKSLPAVIADKRRRAATP